MKESEGKGSLWANGRKLLQQYKWAEDGIAVGVEVDIYKVFYIAPSAEPIT